MKKKIEEFETVSIIKKRGRPIGSKNIKKKKINKIKKQKSIKLSSKKEKTKNRILSDIVLSKKADKDIKIEIWKVRDNIYKIYSENKELLEKLAKNIGSNICATYSTGAGKDFAWDMFFEKKDLSYINKICKKLL